MALMAARGELHPMPIAAVFADTGDEPAAVYQWLEYLKKELPFPVDTVYRTVNGKRVKLSESALELKTSENWRLYTKTTLPVFTRQADGTQGKIRGRQCTSDFKMEPIIAYSRQLVKIMLPEWRRNHATAIRAINRARERKHPVPLAAWDECQQDPLVMMWVGISADEVSRVKPSRYPWILKHHPLVDAGLTRADCLTWMEQNGFARPPRSACRYCPYHNDEEWLSMKQEEPQEFEGARIFERNLQETLAQIPQVLSVPYLHRTLQLLDTVDFERRLADRDTKDSGTNSFVNECEGLCGV